MKFVVFGGGGKVARHFAKLASSQGDDVISVVRNEDHFPDLKSLGAKPHVLSLEESTVPELTTFLTESHPDAVIFAAGAGGKGDKSRTRAVDYDGAVKVYDAMEASNCKRLLLVGAIDVRNREKGFPEYYDEYSRQKSDQMWKAIPEYMKAKYDAEVELHSRKQLQFTVIRPGGLTLEPAKGVEMGITQVGTTSRELVAQVLLACSKQPGSGGLTIDVMDGEGSVDGELKKVVDGKIDAWIG